MNIFYIMAKKLLCDSLVYLHLLVSFFPLLVLWRYQALPQSQSASWVFSPLPTLPSSANTYCVFPLDFSLDITTVWYVSHFISPLYFFK